LVSRSGGVCARDVVRDDAQRDDDTAKFPEAAEDESAGGGVVCGCESGIGYYSCAENDTHEGDPDEGEGETDKKGGSLVGVDGVVSVGERHGYTERGGEAVGGDW